MRVETTALPGVVQIFPRVFGDARGFFVETFQAARYAEHGIGSAFVQDNASRSRRGVLRGLHLQHPNAQGKLVYVLEGEVFDVAVDVRVGSPTFGRSVGVVLDAGRCNQLYIPPGFAHGFAVLSETALFAYKCTTPYAPEHELGIAWDDPALGITWPLDAPTLSERDLSHPRLADVSHDRLPPYEAP